MSGPFPGMDPWLEDPAIWPGVHAALIIYIRDALQPLLRPHYVAAVEERVYVTTTWREMVPDIAVRPHRSDQTAQVTALTPHTVGIVEADEPVVLEAIEHEVHEPYIQIFNRRTHAEVVTVVEILSPTNKRSGEGRDAYLAKQQQVLQSTANLIEIDLLRAGEYSLGVPEWQIQEVGAYDYVVVTSRSRDRHSRSFAYPRFVRERLPRIAVPLRSEDASLSLDLQAVLNRAYDAGDYFATLTYAKPCIPRLRPDDETWAQEQIRAWRAAAQ